MEIPEKSWKTKPKTIFRVITFCQLNFLWQNCLFPQSFSSKEIQKKEKKYLWIRAPIESSALIGWRDRGSDD